MSLASENSDKLHNSQDKDIWSNGVPLMYIHYLAVVSSCQKNGLGKILLMNALSRAVAVSKNVAFYGIGLRSLNENTTAFYRRMNFETAPEEGQHPLMLMPIWTAIDLFQAK